MREPTGRHSPENAGKPAKLSREERLKAALKANMGRRKAQAKARTVTEGPAPDNDNKDE